MASIFEAVASIFEAVASIFEAVAPVLCRSSSISVVLVKRFYRGCMPSQPTQKFNPDLTAVDRDKSGCVLFKNIAFIYCNTLDFFHIKIG